MLLQQRFSERNLVHLRPLIFIRTSATSFMVKNSSTQKPTLKSLSVTFLLLISTLAASLGNVSAIGPNQNDLGSNGDLPDNTSVNLTNYIFTGSYSGTGELDYGDDEDWLRVALNSNQGLAVQLSFSSTTTLPNGTTTTNDFDLIMTTTNNVTLDSSIFNNPETVTTNNSQTPHGGMVYIGIGRYSGVGAWTLTMWKFNVQSTGGGGGISNGSAPPSPCTGNNTVQSDILEPNDTQQTATLASVLPISCTGLSLHTTTDVDMYEIQLVAGVTYYVNITFTHANGDIDAGWESSTGTFLDSGSSVTDDETLQYTATSNMTSFVDVYLYSFSGVSNQIYSISIETDNPGGGQTFETVDVTMSSTTSGTVDFSGLTNGTTFSYNITLQQILNDGSSVYSTIQTGNFTANATTMNMNVTYTPSVNESYVVLRAELYSSTGTMLDDDFDFIYCEMLEMQTTSSTTGTLTLTNLSSSIDYDLEWFVLDLVDYNQEIANGYSVDDAVNLTQIDRDVIQVSASSTQASYNITWNGPTTMNTHALIGFLYENGTNLNMTSFQDVIGFHEDEFIPQLPSILILNVSTSSTASTNDVTTRGHDLVAGDDYDYQIKIVDAGNATIAQSGLISVTATSQGMSFGTWNYTTPTSSGQYCAIAELFESDGTQRIGDSTCFNFVFDDDNDGVANELDLCANTTAGATVDANGCALDQKDTDGDGYNDYIDDFPTDATQYSDMDGDGYGDNASGNSPDAFPTDSTQWSDADGDGYGDNASGNAPDAFPADSTQWSDTDGDGYGDNPAGSNPDLWPADGTQWKDSDGDGYGDNPTGTNGDAFPNDATQWKDTDGDGYGDNASGTNGDEYPNDATQWKDTDGDGYGDNPTGTNGDAFPNDSTQWSDADGDGYGDNQNGDSPDIFPADSTQWADADGDGYGDNQAGMNADKFPSDPTQWFDADGDGYGDNPAGTDGDQCVNTPAGEPVDENGCSESQLDDDMDGVTNDIDACPNTTAGESVDAVGCAASQEDEDKDGINDAFDACPGTPLGYSVDATGCAERQLDSDGDTITNDIDECPSTPSGVQVNGVGCAASERDTDRDGVMDADDICDASPIDEEADANGCTDSQKDDDLDLFTNDIDQCPGTPAGETVDAVGCAQSQLDADNDGFYNNEDQCRSTPVGEQVDAVGCSDTQKDDDGDNVNNARDECPNTADGRIVDSDGCSKYQLDSDDDGVFDIDDECPSTLGDTLVLENGCSLSQIDSDGDLVSDAEDDFPYDANETTDSDGDGVPDRYDKYPQDATRSKAETESDSNLGLYVILVVLILGGLGGIGFMNARKGGAQTIESAFAQTSADLDAATEAQFSEKQDNNPLEGAQQWVDNGVHWNKDAEGNLSYFDATTQAWIPYQQ